MTAARNVSHLLHVKVTSSAANQQEKIDRVHQGVDAFIGSTTHWFTVSTAPVLRCAITWWPVIDDDVAHYRCDVEGWLADAGVHRHTKLLHRRCLHNLENENYDLDGITIDFFVTKPLTRTILPLCVDDDDDEIIAPW